MTSVIRDPARPKGQLNSRPNGWKNYDIEVVDVGDPQNEVVTQTITVNPKIYLIVLIVYTIAQIGLAFIAYSVRSIPIANLGLDWTWGGLVFALQVPHLALSFTYVRADEFGGFLFFGQPVMEIERGLKFRPLFFLRMESCSRKVQQSQFPGDPELVFKGSDENFFNLSESDREKLVLPIRATTNKPRKKVEVSEGRDENALDTQMTLEVNFYVRWQILHFFAFFIRIGDTKEGLRQLRDSGERVIVTEIASKTPQEVIRNLGNINEVLDRGLSEVTEDWGINVLETAMLSPDFTHKVNASLRDVVDAKARASSKKIEARAEEVRLSREGRGKASAKLADLKAMSDGAKELGIDPNQVIALEATKAIAGEGTTIFFDGGGKDDASSLGIGTRLVAGGLQAFNKTPHRSHKNDVKDEGDSK